jgi:hypothetical protein
MRARQIFSHRARQHANFRHSRVLKSRSLTRFDSGMSRFLAAVVERVPPSLTPRRASRDSAPQARIDRPVDKVTSIAPAPASPGRSPAAPSPSPRPPPPQGPGRRQRSCLSECRRPYACLGSRRFGRNIVRMPITGKNEQTRKTKLMPCQSASDPSIAAPMPPIPKINPKNRPETKPTRPGISSCPLRSGKCVLPSLEVRVSWRG